MFCVFFYFHTLRLYSVKAYGDVINEIHSRTSFESTRRIHHEDPLIHTIVPGDSKRVVLLSTKSRGSDWDLTVKDEQDSNGVESEDSGFQVDVDSSKIAANDAVVTGVTKMTVTTKKVTTRIIKYRGVGGSSVFSYPHLYRWQSGTTVINITPPNKMEHRLLEHLHSTPLPSIISAEVADDGRSSTDFGCAIQIQSRYMFYNLFL